jgi:hypothetical protein
MVTPLTAGTPSDDAVRLHHGTDEVSANDLLASGVDQARAAAFNVSGEFWATTSQTDAETFAQVNPAGGVPARFSFDLPRWVLEALVASIPPEAYRHATAWAEWYEFLPNSFPILNRHMTNREAVSPVP